MRNNGSQVTARALLSALPQRMVLIMRHLRTPHSLTALFAVALLGCLFVALPPACNASEPSQQATAAFNSYAASLESRLARQHRQPRGFLVSAASTPQSEAQLRRGELIIEKLSPTDQDRWPGAMLHHWRGIAFAPGATAAGFESLMRNFSAYPQRFSPQVVQARVLSQHGDRVQAILRVRQKHVITVVMDTAYDIDFAQLDPLHRYSLSRSTRIDEIASPGAPGERPLTPAQQHGFLWRLNTYWSCEERDGGLYMQIESISLTRAIPAGLGWAIGPFVESVPRESLEFTLQSVLNALRK